MFLSLIVVGCCILHLVSSYYWRNTNNAQLNTSDPEDLIKAIDREKEYALDLIGRDSVYRYFLSESWKGWGIALGTVAAQSALIYVFIDASEIEFSTDVDVEYTWECPRDELQCRNTTGVTYYGWIAYALLITAHILKDVLNGLKLVALSGTGGHPKYKRICFLFGGAVLVIISVFTIYASTTYNMAIAVRNTDLITNAVIIIFISDMDELIDDLVMEINPYWITKKEAIDEEQDVEEQEYEEPEAVHEVNKLSLLESENLELKTKLSKVESQVQELCAQMIRAEIDIQVLKTVEKG